jgi:hypothetical protein
MLGGFFGGHAQVEVQNGAVMVRLREGSVMEDKAVLQLAPAVALDLADKLRWGADRANLEGPRTRLVEGITAAVGLVEAEKPNYIFR